MGADRFAVLTERARSRRELVAEGSLEELMESASGLEKPRGAERLLAVEYKRSGHDEIARAQTMESLLSKVSWKAGVR